MERIKQSYKQKRLSVKEKASRLDLLISGNSLCQKINNDTLSFKEKKKSEKSS